MSNKDRPEFYVLVDRTPIAVNMEMWANWFENKENRRIAHDQIEGTDCWVSTVFLGLDHNFGRQGPPILFETMIFGGPLDEPCWRYATYAEAERGHAEAVVQARKAIAQVRALANNAGAKVKAGDK